MVGCEDILSFAWMFGNLAVRLFGSLVAWIKGCLFECLLVGWTLGSFVGCAAVSFVAWMFGWVCEYLLGRVYVFAFFCVDVW